MKPGTGPKLSETREEFAERMGKEMRKEAKRILDEAQKQAKEYRKIASRFDGHRS